uniref:Protein TIFY n=2 Tax=Aegilops tauschii subsp. strangulata TaxID=200361 RepID=A0A453D6W7_AEGTS
MDLLERSAATIKAEQGEAQRKEAERKEQEQEQEHKEQETQQPGLTGRPPLANGRSGMLPMSSPPANPGQLTIFYGGSVCVYDSVPPEKAQAIMLIAAAAAAASKSNGTTAVKPPAMSATNAIQAMLTRSLSLQSTSVANGQPQAVADPGSICKLQADLPIARRHSLQRFLEKRRDRLA